MRWFAIPMMMGGLALAGCGAQSRDSAFTEVQKTVTDRSGQRIHWNQGAAEDEQAATAVRTMLASELTADAAVQIALLNNRNLQAMYEDLGVAQADLVRAGLLHNPVFSADAKFHPGGGVRLEFSLVDDFLDVLYIPMRKRLAEAAFAGTKLRVAGAVIDLAGETRIAFYRLQMAEQALATHRSEVEAASLASDLAQRIHAAGNSTLIDAAMPQDRYEQDKLDQAAAELEVTEQRERLNTLMGVWGLDTSWTAVADLPDLPADEMDVTGLEKRAITSSLDLAAAKADIDRNAQLLGNARPLAASSEVDLGVAGEKEIDGTRSIGPAASVPIPIFNAGGPAVVAARAELRRSQDLYAAEAVEIRSKVRTARARLLFARDQTNYIRQVVIPLRQRVVGELQLQYNGMLASPFRLIEAKHEEIEATGHGVQALGGYWIARANLDQLLAGRMPADDEMPTASMAPQATVMDGGH